MKHRAPPTGPALGPSPDIAHASSMSDEPVQVPVRVDGNTGAMPSLSPRYRAALVVARLAAWLSRRLLHRSGNVIGGAVLRRLALPSVLAQARGHRIIVVSGTNGKSTTTAMVTAALRTAVPVTTNADGANTPHGLLWTIANARTHDLVLEVDEMWVPWAVRNLGVHTAVLLNLTRDQLHRKPEIMPLAEAWRTAMADVQIAVASADDPAVTWAAETAPHVEHVGTGATWLADATLCPRCGGLLRHQEGDWDSPCGFTRPATPIHVSGDSIVVGHETIAPHLTLPGAANLGNLASAIAATRDRVDPRRAAEAVAESVRDVAGRYAEVEIDGRQVRLLLAKNPAGWQAALGMLREDASALLAMSADGVDGLDTSWLYDIDFEVLRGRPVAVTGPRGMDMVVRLHLDDIETGSSVPSARAGLQRLPRGPVDLLATYSTFQAARKELHVA